LKELFGLSIKKTKSPPSAASIIKQINYGTAVGLTRTAKQAQAAVQSDVPKQFTYRNRWLPQSNKFGIRITSATPAQLTASIQTNADWLQKQKEGGNISASADVRTFHYTYAGKRYIAIPSRLLRPKGSTKVISKSLWPSALRRKKGAFVILTRGSKTPILMVRFAPGKDGYEAMYILKPDVPIKAKDAFTPPIERVVRENLQTNIATGIENALKTAK
jgi:hypothetical protein